MKMFLIAMAVLMAMAVPAVADVVNGQFNSGETGWTHWKGWGDAELSWTITNTGPTPPEGTLTIPAYKQGSFGWYQAFACPAGNICTLNADWTGNIGGAGWAEVMFWTTPVAENYGARADAGAAADTAFKKDSWGMNPPTTWGWQPANLSPRPGGNNGVLTSQGIVVVAMKLGSGTVGENFARYTRFDNIVVTCVPEPGSLLALCSGLIGLGGLVIRKRH